VVLFIGFNLTFFPAIHSWLSRMRLLYHTYPRNFRANVFSTNCGRQSRAGYLLPML